MMSCNTGRDLSELDHIKQSIVDILTTPIGTRLMRRDYGSILPDLMAQPMNDVLILKIYSAIYTALLKWESRITINQIVINHIGHGNLTIDLDTVYLITDQSINLSIPLNMGAV